MLEKRSVCLRRLGGTRAGARSFSRFLDNDAVTVSEMVALEAERVSRLCAGRHVLALQDTTELNFASHRGRKRGFGTVYNGTDIGLFAHPVLAVDAAQGGILGLADIAIINRIERPALKKTQRPIEQKESQRWIDGANAAGEVLAAARTVTVVADRESDIYAAFAAPRGGHVHLLTRAAQDRSLADGTRLFTVADGLASAGTRTIRVSAKPGERAAREAVVSIGFDRVAIARPDRIGHKTLSETLSLTLVVAREVDPPAGEKPILWRLLTTHAVDTFAQALDIVDWYRARWTIEQLFRLTKSQGLDLEASQVTTAPAMEKLATLALIAASRILQLVMARDASSDQAITDAVDEADLPLVEALIARKEGKTDRLRNNHPKQSIKRFHWLIGRLGGWDGYVGNGYKPAGPITIAHGLESFNAIKEGWRLKNVGLP